MPKLVIYMTELHAYYAAIGENPHIIDSRVFPFANEEYGAYWAKSFPTDIVMWVEE